MLSVTCRFEEWTLGRFRLFSGSYCSSLWVQSGVQTGSDLSVFHTSTMGMPRSWTHLELGGIKWLWSDLDERERGWMTVFVWRLWGAPFISSIHSSSVPAALPFLSSQTPGRLMCRTKTAFIPSLPSTLCLLRCSFILAVLEYITWKLAESPKHLYFRRSPAELQLLYHFCSTFWFSRYFLQTHRTFLNVSELFRSVVIV